MPSPIGMRQAQAHNTHQPGNTVAALQRLAVLHVMPPTLQPRLASKQAKLAHRTCAEHAKLKMRTVRANAGPQISLCQKFVLARPGARPAS